MLVELKKSTDRKINAPESESVLQIINRVFVESFYFSQGDLGLQDELARFVFMTHLGHCQMSELASWDSEQLKEMGKSFKEGFYRFLTSGKAHVVVVAGLEEKERRVSISNEIDRALGEFKKAADYTNMAYLTQMRKGTSRYRAKMNQLSVSILTRMVRVDNEILRRRKRVRSVDMANLLQGSGEKFDPILSQVRRYIWERQPSGVAEFDICFAMARPELEGIKNRGLLSSLAARDQITSQGQDMGNSDLELVLPLLVEVWEQRNEGKKFFSCKS